MKYYSIFMALLCLVLAFSSCKKEPVSPVEGSWIATQSEFIQCNDPADNGIIDYTTQSCFDDPNNCNENLLFLEDDNTYHLLTNIVVNGTDSVVSIRGRWGYEFAGELKLCDGDWNNCKLTNWNTDFETATMLYDTDNIDDCSVLITYKRI